jgi:hypothetical protein
VKAYYQNPNPPPPPQIGDDPPIILSINIIVTFMLTRYLEAEGLEKTYHFKQSDIVKAVDISTANKVICIC